MSLSRRGFVGGVGALFGTDALAGFDGCRAGFCPDNVPMVVGQSGGALSDLFHGSNGAWLAPDRSGTLYRTNELTLRARYHGPIKGIKDQSGCGNDATQATTANAPRYASDVTTGKLCAWFKQGFDTLGLTFSGSLGSDCTVVYANGSSVEFLTGQTVGATFTIAKTFFQFLIIDRALTVSETERVRSYFSQRCPNYINAYDFYVNASRPDDSGDGLTAATAKKTFAAASAQLIASATGKRLCVLPGTYADQFDATAGTIAKTHYIHCPQAGVVFDMGGTPGGGSISCIETEANGYTLNFYGDGNATIQNVQNNGFAVHGSAIVNAYDCLVTACDDGLSAHDTGTLRAYRCTVTNCTKGAFTHVSNTSVVSTAYHEFCAFYGRLSAGQVGNAGEKGVNFDFFGCDILPDPATTSTWTAFRILSSNANSGVGTTRKFRFCRFGNPSITVGAAAIWTFYSTAFEDCYFGGVYLAQTDATNDCSMLRCYGKWTLRLRYITDRRWLIDNCVWIGGGMASAQESGRAVNGNFYNGTTDVFGAGYVRNSIIKGLTGTAAIFATSNTAVMNTNWEFSNNCFNGNTTANYTSGVTADGVDVIADPLLSAPTSDEQGDFRVTAGSPTLGAGIGGTDIGLGLVAA